MEIVVTASHFCNLDFIPNIWIGLKSASEACGPLIPASFVPPRDVSSMTAPKTWHDFMNSNWSESSTGTGSISIKDFHWRDSHQWVASMHSSQRWARSLAFKTFLLDPARIPRQNCQITSTRHTTKIKMLNLTISQVLLLDPRDGLHPRALARKSHRLLCRPEQDRERGRRTGEWNFFFQNWINFRKSLLLTIFSGDRLLPLVAFPAHLLLRLCQVPAQRLEELPWKWLGRYFLLFGQFNKYLLFFCLCGWEREEGTKKHKYHKYFLKPGI